MTKYKWTYVAKGHYSTTEDGWTVHVLDDGAVYKTRPSRATTAITGGKADKYIESAQTKFPVRGKKRAPDSDPKEERATSPKHVLKTPKKRVTKKQISAAAKKLAKGAGSIIGTTRAFVTEIGEAEERTYTKRKPPALKKKATKKTKPAKKSKRAAPVDVRPTIVRKKKTSRRRSPPAHATEHPLEYLVSGGGAMPPSGRRKGAKKQHEQTLEECLGF